MDIHTNIPLKNFTTMKLGGNAKYFIEARSPADIAAAFAKAKAESLPVFVLGTGSNVIAHDEGFNGIILRVRISGFDVISDTASTTTVRLGAGEDWDAIVKRTVDMNLSGIEAMSAIPGTVGATPVQNVGAYGQEIADTLQAVEAYDGQTGNMVTLTNEQCEFSYRDSIFRNREKGRYVITAITLKLSKNPPVPPFYDSLQKYFDERGVKLFTPEAVRNAVIDIRSVRLPDPRKLPNSGSFFKNVIVEAWQLGDLKAKFPEMPAYEMADGRAKIPAGWLIEQAGLKGKLLHGVKVYENNALILVNESATSYNDLASARQEIINTVRDKFGLQLEQEPLEI